MAKGNLGGLDFRVRKSELDSRQNERRREHDVEDDAALSPPTEGVRVGLKTRI